MQTGTCLPRMVAAT